VHIRDSPSRELKQYASETYQDVRTKSPHENRYAPPRLIFVGVADRAQRRSARPHPGDKAVANAGSSAHTALRLAAATKTLAWVAQRPEPDRYSCFAHPQQNQLPEIPKATDWHASCFCPRHVFASTRRSRNHLDDYAALHPETVPAATIEEDQQHPVVLFGRRRRALWNADSRLLLCVEPLARDRI